MTDENLNLEELTNQTYQELESENLDHKRSEIKKKLRYVYERIQTLKNLILYHEKQISKCCESIKKAEDKIDQIKKGNWNILNQINPEEKLPQVPKEEKDAS